MANQTGWLLTISSAIVVVLLALTIPSFSSLLHMTKAKVFTQGYQHLTAEQQRGLSGATWEYLSYPCTEEGACMLGAGYSADLSRMVNTPFSDIGFQDEKDHIAEVEGMTRMISDADSYEEAITASAKIHASGWGASLAATASYAKEKMRSSNAVYYSWLRVWKEQATTMPNKYPKFSPDALKLVSAGSDDLFADRYGKYFCARFVRGGYYNAIFTLKTKHISDKESVKAAVGASFSGWGATGSGSAEFESGLKKATSHSELKIEAKSSAWNQEKHVVGAESCETRKFYRI